MIALLFTLFYLIAGAAVIWLALVIYRVYATSTDKFIDEVTRLNCGGRKRGDDV